MSDRKKPYTKEEFVNIIVEGLKAKGDLPEILDYYLADREETGKTFLDEKFSFESSLDFGGSEGIYLDIYIVREKRERLCVFKTLDRTRAAMTIMGELLGHFIYDAVEFVNRNLDDFTWVGFDVYALKDGKRCWGYSEIQTKEKAFERAYEFIEKYGYDEAVVIDNETKDVIKTLKKEIKA